MEKAKIFIEYPELIALNDEATEYDGYITVEDKFTCRIQLKIPNFPSIKNISCKIPALPESQLNFQATDIFDYLQKLHDFMRRFVHKPIENSEFFSKTFTEYKQLCEHESIEKIKCDKAFKMFKIKIKDVGGRFHYLAIGEHEQTFQLVYHYLPQISAGHELMQRYGSLIKLFTVYLKIVDELQTIFNVMDSIDTVCWVIDPVKPKRSDFMRRIMIAPNISIQITFDPWNVYNLPQIQFMGSESGVAPFRTSFINNLDNWDPEYDVVQNILRLIDLPYFPMAPTKEIVGNDLDFKTNECCICFCVHLNDKLPDEICKNTTCEQHFHTDCLYQWLSAVGTSRQNFNLIQGECPNCKTCITCPIPNI